MIWNVQQCLFTAAKNSADFGVLVVVSPQKFPSYLLSVSSSPPTSRTVCMLGPYRGWQGILTISFAFHHRHKEIQRWVKTPETPSSEIQVS